MTTEYGPFVVWGVALVVGLATFSFRHSFVYLFGRVDSVPPRVERVLGYVPPAVLGALAIPAFVPAEASLSLALSVLVDERIVAGVVGAAVAWKTDDLGLTVVVGMAAFWAVRFLG